MAADNSACTGYISCPATDHRFECEARKDQEARSYARDAANRRRWQIIAGRKPASTDVQGDGLAGGAASAYSGAAAYASETTSALYEDGTTIYFDDAVRDGEVVDVFRNERGAQTGVGWARRMRVVQRGGEWVLEAVNGD